MQNNECKKNDWAMTMAFWLLRIWLAVRAITTGLVKFQGTGPRLTDKAKLFEAIGDPDITTVDQAVQNYGSIADLAKQFPDSFETVSYLSTSFYHGLPARGPMSIEGFAASPLMPTFMVQPYAMVLGVALIGLGLALLAGVCTRITLFLMGLLYVSLTYGFLILEPVLKDASAAGAAFLGVHMIMIVAALALSKYNKFELLPCGKLPFCKCCDK
ncbi:MAG: hypothetical protein J6P03_08990 [Opitutales bacterium]|nr:hypothetical protein [Opitutales bacterium]